MASPYAATHAIYVRQNVRTATPEAGEIPEVLSRRLLSIRSVDAAGHILDADVIDGTALRPALQAMIDMDEVAWVDIHFAKRGCFAARAIRA